MWGFKLIFVEFYVPGDGGQFRQNSSDKVYLNIKMETITLITTFLLDPLEYGLSMRLWTLMLQGCEVYMLICL